MYINICAGVHTKSARNIIVMLAHIIYKYEYTHIGIHNVHIRFRTEHGAYATCQSCCCWRCSLSSIVMLCDTLMRVRALVTRSQRETNTTDDSEAALRIDGGTDAQTLVEVRAGLVELT